MKFKSLVACFALVASAPTAFAALATCGSGITAMSSGSTQLFGNAFSSAQSFSDCYSFSVSSTAIAFGGTFTIDPLSFLDINVSSVTLRGASLITSLVDTTPGIFSFSSLDVGTYQLVVSGSVTKGGGFDDFLPLPVGYAASLTATLSDPVAVPEPGSLALLGLGLIGVATMRRRQQT